MAPYGFMFGDAPRCTPGTCFGPVFESRPGVYDYSKGNPMRLRPNAMYSSSWKDGNEIIVAPPHDGRYDFYLDVSGDVPVTYIREHR